MKPIFRIRHRDDDGDSIALVPTFDTVGIDDETQQTVEALGDAFERTGTTIIIDDPTVTRAFMDDDGTSITVSAALDRVYAACINPPPSCANAHEDA